MTIHAQIEVYIMDRINNEILKPGDCIETERELAELFHASRPTVRQAISKLTTMGYLFRIKGKGTFVSKPKTLHHSSCVIESYRQEIGDRHLFTQVNCLQTIHSGKTLADAMDLPLHTPVIELVRTRRIETDKPVVFTSVYVPYNRFPEMMQLDFTDVSFYDSLHAHGLQIAHVIRTIEMVLPSPDIARKLEISPFEPVFYVITHGYTEDDQLMEYSESYYPGGTSKFLIDIH